MFEELLKMLSPTGAMASAAVDVGKSAYNYVTQEDEPTSYDTKLTPEEELAFQAWKQKNAPDDSGEDYDLRGAFKSGFTPDPQTGHWPDTFKKPNHPTFSDESVYAKGKEAPKAGHWEGDTFVPPQPEEEASASLAKTTDDGSLDFIDRSFLGIQAGAPINHIEAALNPAGEAAFRSQVKPIRLYTDDELTQTVANPEDPNYNNAKNERLLRKRWERQSTLENLSDPDYVARHSKDLADQFVISVPRIPGDILSIAGMVAAAPSAVGSDVGAETAQDILQTGAEYYTKVNEIFQTHEPQNPLETLASIAPSAAIPVGAGAKLGGGMMRNIAELATPFTIGGGAGRQVANVGAQFIGSELIRTVAKDEKDQYETIFNSFFSPGDVEAAGSDPELDFTIGSTPEGAKIRNSDLRKFGYFGLGTIGLMVTPSIARVLAKKLIKDPSRIADPTGVMFPKTLETPVLPRDVVLTHWADPVAGMMNSAKRTGVDLGQLRFSTEMNTSAALQNKIGQSMTTGRLETFEGVPYKNDIPVDVITHHYDVLDDATKKAADDYADMLHRIDYMKKNNKATWLGTTRAAAQKNANDLARAYPFVKALQEGYRRSVRAMKDFHSEGEYATLTKSSASKVEPNFHPRVLDPERYGSTPTAKDRWSVRSNVAPPPHVSPYVSMKQWTEQMMRDRILNSVRGSFVDHVRSTTGDRLFHKLPVNKAKRDALLNRNKLWKKNVVSFSRHGVVEHYVTNPLWHDTLRFDPNYQRHAGWNTMGRTFQFWTTGHGAPWFAATRFARDTSLVQIATPPGFRPLGMTIGEIPIPIPGMTHLHGLYGVGEQLFRKGQIALAQKMRRAADTPGNNWLKDNYGEAALRATAQMWADNFQRSTYHAIMGSGGADVSYARHAVQNARTGIRDFLDSKAPEWAKAIGHAYANILDAGQNAGVYSLIARKARDEERRLGRGLSQTELDEIVARGKPVTGDVTIAGRSFVKDSGGERTFGLGKGKVSGLAKELPGQRTLLEKSAGAAQFGREAIPFFNSTVQSLKSIGSAYWRNPYRFMSKLWVYVGIPQLLSYTVASNLDAQNGNNDILNYMFEGRSEYQKSTSLYLPVPGGRPEDGYEIPFALEVAPLGYMFMNSLDWMFRHESNPKAISPTRGMVMNTVFNNFFGLTMPPGLGAGAGLLYGYQIPSSIPGFGDQPYEPKENQYGALPRASKALGLGSKLGSNVELAIRNTFGGAAGVYIGMINSLMDEGDILAAAKEGAYQFKERLPIVRSAKRGTFTAINQQNLAYKDKMSELEKLHRIWIKGEGKVRSSTPGGELPGRMSLSGVPERPQGMIEQGTLDLTSRPFLDPAEAIQATPFEIEGKTYLIPTVKEGLQSMLTKTGKVRKGKDDIKYYKNHNYGVFMDEASAEAYKAQLEHAEMNIQSEPLSASEAKNVAAPEVPPPTNWVYIAAADKIHEAFETQSLGFTEMTKNLKDVTESVHELKRLESGKLGEWKAHLDSMEDGITKDRLKDIDPTKRSDVQKAINIYEDRRISVLKKMRELTNGVENDLSKEISQLAGKEVKIDLLDLDPYGEPPVPEPIMAPDQAYGASTP